MNQFLAIFSTIKGLFGNTNPMVDNGQDIKLNPIDVWLSRLSMLFLTLLGVFLLFWPIIHNPSFIIWVTGIKLLPDSVWVLIYSFFASLMFARTMRDITYSRTSVSQFTSFRQNALNITTNDNPQDFGRFANVANTGDIDLVKNPEDMKNSAIDAWRKRKGLPPNATP